MVYIPPSDGVDRFYIDRHEVTNREFTQFLQAHGREGREIAGKEDEPVVRVSFRDATAYANWVGKRIPTEEEWEAAAKHSLENPDEGMGSQYTVAAEWTDTNYAGKEDFKTIRRGVILSEPFSETAPMHVDDLNDSTTFRCAK